MSDEAPEQGRIAAFVDRETIKLMYKPVALIASVVGGLIAARTFARIWRALTGKEDAAGATDQGRSWTEVLPAAALHGLVFGVVKAIVDRASAEEFQRLTGYWPGKKSPRADHISGDAQLASGPDKSQPDGQTP